MDSKLSCSKSTTDCLCIIYLFVVTISKKVLQWPLNAGNLIQIQIISIIQFETDEEIKKGNIEKYSNNLDTIYCLFINHLLFIYYLFLLF
jgi:hypothetical protein